MRYRDAGVDVSRADAIKDEILREIHSTWNADVAPLTGGFAGVMRFPALPGAPVFELRTFRSAAGHRRSFACQQGA